MVRTLTQTALWGFGDSTLVQADWFGHSCRQLGGFGQRAQNHRFLNPVFKDMFYALGVRYFCCAALGNLIATSSVNVCMMIAIRQNPTFNTGKLPNRYLVSLCTRLCWYRKWKKRVGWAQCVKSWQGDRNCLGMRESAGVGIAQAQGAVLHN